ncbi:MAG: hypothetical protein ACD_77C00080G0002, partial [uncultured bacterium]
MTTFAHYFINMSDNNLLSKLSGLREKYEG